MSQLSTTFVAVAMIATALTSFTPLTRADAPAGRYTNVDVAGIAGVKDNVTSLVWMRNERSGTYTWDLAKAACIAVGAGWRLPDVGELTNLVDEARPTAPAIDVTFFQGPTAGSMPTATSIWSSTAYTLAAGHAWRVTFDGGFVFYYPTTNTYGVRCVR